jgi:hypothetical protein
MAAVIATKDEDSRDYSKESAVVIAQKKRASVITQKRGHPRASAAMITQKKRAAVIAQKRGQP